MSKWKELSVVFVGWIVASSLLMAIYFGCRPPAGCHESEVIEQSWLDALKIAKVPLASAPARPRNVRIVYEARYYPDNVPFVVFRTCGRTELYATKNAAGGWNPVSYDIQVYVAPGDCKMLHLALVHEFLHVIGAEAKNIPLDESEVWVRSIFPATCQ